MRFITIENTDPEFYWLTNWGGKNRLASGFGIRSTRRHTQPRHKNKRSGDSIGCAPVIRPSCLTKLHDFGFRGRKQAAVNRRWPIGGAATICSISSGTDNLAAIELLQLVLPRGDAGLSAFPLPSTPL